MAIVLVAGLVATACVPPIPPVTDAPATGGHVIRFDDAPPVVAWGTSAPHAVVVAAHGLKGTGAVFAQPATRWAARGIATYSVTLDYPTARPEHLAAVIRGAARRHPGVPVLVVAESLGASLAVEVFAAPDAPPVAALVLSAPAVWPDATSASVLRSGLGLLASAGSRSAAYWDRVVALMDRVRDRAAEVRVRPVLVLSGGQDEVVPPRGVEILVARMGDVEFREFPDGGHTLFRNPGGDEVSDQIAEWMLAQASASSAASAASSVPPIQPAAH